MTRVLSAGTGAGLEPADVVIEDGHVTGVGAGRDGDPRLDRASCRERGGQYRGALSPGDHPTHTRFPPAERGAVQLPGDGEEVDRFAPGYRADPVIVAGDADAFEALAGTVREVWPDGARVVKAGGKK